MDETKKNVTEIVELFLSQLYDNGVDISYYPEGAEKAQERFINKICKLVSNNK